MQQINFAVQVGMLFTSGEVKGAAAPQMEKSWYLRNTQISNKIHYWKVALS